MAPSIGHQTNSVRRQFWHQSKGSPAADFFTLPRPEPLSPPMAFQTPPLAFQTESCDALPSTEIDSLLAPAFRREGVEPELIRGVLRQESSFRPCAVSPEGALGITPQMQPMPQTAADPEVVIPFDPADSVTAGTKLLHQLLQHYDADLAFALGPWNAEPRRADAGMAVPAIPGTADYVQRVLSFFLPMSQIRSLSLDSDQP
jgi:hypothetical protein